jgi:hypothetical protein
MPTAEEIEAGRSPAGGWTRAQLAQWGVPWPPPKGWKARLQGRSVIKRSASSGKGISAAVSAAEIRQAYAQMARNKRLVGSGETFRSRYGERGGPITPGQSVKPRDA